MLQGHQTWVFPSQPVIASAASVVGPFEGKGPLARDFDLIHGDTWVGQDSWEKAEKRLLEDACEKAIEKAGLEKEQIQFFIGGDLMSQLISSNFAARTLAVPFLGVFGACSTSMEGLALAAQLVDSGNAQTALCGTSSHNSAAEKTFRYPTEYGGQKPPTAQWTVTGAGAAIIQSDQKAVSNTGLHITSCTIGRVVDMGITDPFNMGGAMAPAAVDTIEAHFRDLRVSFADYDLIVTGDLGRVGYRIAYDLMKKHGLDVSEDKFQDCGILMYGDHPEVLAGGSGAACSAAVTYGHLFKGMLEGRWRKIMVAATGALLSPITVQQKESIPCICHAVVIERRGG
ncbi:stage V sporulation protein AD [Caldalkalibacillus thermarum]|uniref:stage V sporulation protein AD n=1 Tax=Caldalkalibacillus thermarum TaxID=296745 RepID=UPI0016696332|nr:stage V sporulation protein AD [Caldalkalibacillus thermarum]GGK13924.1 stage V sporulation protein AD [Caldalkalibacillus thermarum]